MCKIKFKAPPVRLKEKRTKKKNFRTFYTKKIYANPRGYFQKPIKTVIKAYVKPF